MHELSIAQAIVEQLDDIVRQQGASRVISVTLSVGKLSGVEKDALELAFPMAAEDSPADGATLITQEIPANVTCKACGQTSTPDFPFFVCESCGSDDVDISSGRELTIDSVELAFPS